jgi:trypsin
MRFRPLILTAATLLSAAALAPPAGAVVGGKDAAPGAYPAVAYVQIAGVAGCTGTLIAPSVVLSAGHCGSLTGSLLATPISWPPSAIKVTLGADAPGGPGEQVAVSSVRIPPSYVATTGSDISLLLLTQPAKATPVRIAGRGEEPLWAPGVSALIVGYGETSENGPLPAHLQQANVPIVADATCASSYPGQIDTRTQLCAGFPQGGTDTCQGDSGGPLFGHRPDGSLVVVGATSNGDGCARAGKPGIYARVADSALREWIRGVAGDAVDADVTPAAPASPPVKTCASTRKLTVHVKRIYWGKLRSAVVLVAGRRVATLRGGRRSARVSLAGGKPRTVTVKIVMRLKSGRQVTDTRRLKVCGG